MNKSVADYYPYGKVLREFNPQAEKYLTTHHERDTETGLDYRGARYYDSDACRFLSLDQLAADYVNLSPYNYVAGNPVVFIDADGREIVDAMQNNVCVNVIQNSDGTYSATYEFAEGTVQSIKDNFIENGARIINTLIQIESGRELVNDAINHEDKIQINISSGEHKKGALGRTRDLKDSDGNVVGSEVTIYEGTISKQDGSTTQGQEYKLYNLNQDQKVARTGAHELTHATDDNELKDRKAGIKLTVKKHQKAQNAGKVAAVEFGELNNKVESVKIEEKK